MPYTLKPGREDVWRNFVIPIALSEPHYVKTVEVKPGSARFVHHALIAVDEMRSSRRRDEQDREAGFEGMDMGDAHMPEGPLLDFRRALEIDPGHSDARRNLNAALDRTIK